MYVIQEYFIHRADAITSGHLAVSADEKTVCVTNLESGSDLYLVPTMQRIKTFVQPIDPDLNHAIQGTLDLDGIFVTGSSSGMVYAYDITSGRRVFSLKHAEG